MRDALKILEEHGKVRFIHDCKTSQLVVQVVLISGTTCEEDGVKFIAVD